MKRSIFPLLYLILISCNTNYGQLTLVTRLPKDLQENSGMESMARDSTVWVINDSGNKNRLYQVAFDGKIRKDIRVKHAKNVDWEELTKDDDNNLYIGDFGNNNNDRKDLTIYKIKDPGTVSDEDVSAEKITFNYLEQTDFPPKKKHKYYDAEAFFYLNGNFYLFTKNHTTPFDGICFLYKIPAKEGHHKAQLIGKHTSCTEEDNNNCKITAAAISPDKKTIALLSHNKVWLLSDFKGDDFFNAEIQQTIELQHTSQKEGLCFLDEHTLLISDEGKGSSGRNLYKLHLTTIKN